MTAQSSNWHQPVTLRYQTVLSSWQFCTKCDPGGQVGVHWAVQTTLQVLAVTSHSAEYRDRNWLWDGSQHGLDWGVRCCTVYCDLPGGLGGRLGLDGALGWGLELNLAWWGWLYKGSEGDSYALGCRCCKLSLWVKSEVSMGWSCSPNFDPNL